MAAPKAKTSRKNKISSKIQGTANARNDLDQRIENVTSTLGTAQSTQEEANTQQGPATAKQAPKTPQKAADGDAPSSLIKGSRPEHPQSKPTRRAKVEKAPEAEQPPSESADAVITVAEPAAVEAAAEPVITDQEKVIRDTFSFPPGDYALIARLQDEFLDLKLKPSKSDILRAGLHALLEMDADNRKRIMAGLQQIKPGRRARK